MPSRKRYVLAIYRKEVLWGLVIGVPSIITHVQDVLMGSDMSWPTACKTWPERLEKSLKKLKRTRRSKFGNVRPVLKLIETRERRGVRTKESPTMAVRRFNFPKPRALAARSRKAKKKSVSDFIHDWAPPAQGTTQLTPHPGNPIPMAAPAVEAFLPEDLL